MNQGWGQVQLTKYSSTSSIRNIYQVQVLVKYSFIDSIGKISASIEDSDISNFIILGDFNSAVDTAFESELLEFCTSYDLSISDYEF